MHMVRDSFYDNKLAVYEKERKLKISWYFHHRHSHQSYGVQRSTLISWMTRPTDVWAYTWFIYANSPIAYDRACQAIPCHLDLFWEGVLVKLICAKFKKLPDIPFTPISNAMKNMLQGSNSFLFPYIRNSTCICMLLSMLTNNEYIIVSDIYIYTYIGEDDIF